MATSTLDTKPLDDQFTQFSSRIKLVNKKFEGKTDKKKYVILLIRHGFSCANRFKDTTKVLGGARQQYAYPASGLTGYGIKQALKFRDFMQQINDISRISKYIYSSNLLRAMETAKYIIDSDKFPIKKVFPIDGIREISGTLSCSSQSSGWGNTKDNVPLSLDQYKSKYPNNYDKIKNNLATPEDEGPSRSNSKFLYGWREDGKPKTSIQCDVHQFIKDFLPLVDEHQERKPYEADDTLFIPVVVHGSLIKKYSEQLKNKTKVENLGTFAIAVSRDSQDYDNIKIEGSVQLNNGVPKNTWNTLYKQLNSADKKAADDAVDKNVYCGSPKNKFNTKPNKRSRKRSKAKSRKRSKAKSRKRSKAKSRKRSKAKSRKRSKAKSRKSSKVKSRKSSKVKSRKSSKAKSHKRSKAKSRKRSKAKSRKRSKAKGKRNRKSFGKSISSFNELVSIKS